MLDLPCDEVHAWAVPLDGPEAVRQTLSSWLSDDERRRAERFVFDRDRNRFVICRGALRNLLSRYLDCPPYDFVFSYGAHGKPSLSHPFEGSLFFNVSHTHELAIIAVRQQGEIGVDVEQLRLLEDANAIARRYFTIREQATLERLPPADRMAAFFRCWTRKEAMLKALGVGLSVALSDVEVTIEADMPAQVLAIRGAASEAPIRWQLHHLAPAPGYVGAVAYQGSQSRLIQQQWTLR